MEPIQFKDTIGALVLLASLVVLMFLYRPYGSESVQRFPRVAGIALMGASFGLLAAAYWTFANLSGNHFEDTFMIPIGLGLIVAAMVCAFLGVRKIQSRNDANHGTTRMDAQRALASLENTHGTPERTPIIVWIHATLFALGVFALFTYPAISTGIVRGKKSTCRIPEDTQCTVAFFSLGFAVALISTFVIFFTVRRLVRWFRG